MISQNGTVAPEETRMFLYEKNYQKIFGVPSTPRFDVTIVGGTLVSASLAHLLALAGLRVCVLDRAPFGASVPVTRVVSASRISISSFFKFWHMLNERPRGLSFTRGHSDSAPIKLGKSAWWRKAQLLRSWLSFEANLQFTIEERKNFSESLLASSEEGALCLPSVGVVNSQRVGDQLFLTVQDLRVPNGTAAKLRTHLLVDCEHRQGLTVSSEAEERPVWKVNALKLALGGPVNAATSDLVKKGFFFCMATLRRDEPLPTLSNRLFAAEYRREEEVRRFKKEASALKLPEGTVRRISNWYGGRVRRFLENPKYLREVVPGVVLGEFAVPRVEEAFASYEEIFISRIEPLLSSELRNAAFHYARELDIAGAQEAQSHAV